MRLPLTPTLSPEGRGILRPLSLAGEGGGEGKRSIGIEA